MNIEDKQILATKSGHLLAIALDLGNIGTTMTRSEAFEWLRANRRGEYFVQLGYYFDIAVYEVDGTDATGTKGCHEQEIGKWFVSTAVGEFLDTPTVPVQDTYEGAYAVACELFGLEKLYEAEQAAGAPLPRVCYGESKPISEMIAHIVREVRQYETLDVSELYMYLGQESGEFSEALLAEQGKMPGKHLKEPALGEAADMLNTTVAILAKHYPKMTPEELGTNLAKWLNIKTHKYSTKLRAKS